MCWVTEYHNKMNMIAKCFVAFQRTKNTVMLWTLYTYSSKPTTLPSLFKSNGITNNGVPVCIALRTWACFNKGRCDLRLFPLLRQISPTIDLFPREWIVCVRVRVCARACVRACARAHANSLMNCKKNFFNPLTPVADSHIIMDKILLFHDTTAPSELGIPHYRGFTITLRYTTFDRTPLDEWPARLSNLYLTTDNTHTGQTSIRPAGFDPAIPANPGLRPRGHWCRR